MTFSWPAGIPLSETSKIFMQHMIDAMGLSYIKYGKVADAYPDKVDAVASLRRRLTKYEQTGNKEWLVDVANFAMIEYMHPLHKDAHVKPTDSKDSPGRKWHGSDFNQKGNKE